MVVQLNLTEILKRGVVSYTRAEQIEAVVSHIEEWTLGEIDPLVTDMYLNVELETRAEVEHYLQTTFSDKQLAEYHARFRLFPTIDEYEEFMTSPPRLASEAVIKELLQAHIPILGSGTARAVFDLKGVVLKVPLWSEFRSHVEMGITEVHMEREFFRKYPELAARVYEVEYRLQDGTVIHVNHAGPFNPEGDTVTIGDEVTVGHRAILHGCTIHDHCLIGMGAGIMDRVVIEPGVFVAAGSLVI